jgi:hypothetical protein
MRLYCIVILCLGVVMASASGQGRSGACDHCAWLRESLDHIETVQAGMFRADLERLFTYEGGIYSRSQQTYVYRKCPYIKVDVEFARSEENQNSGDRISKISRPYIARPIID